MLNLSRGFTVWFVRTVSAIITTVPKNPVPLFILLVVIENGLVLIRVSQVLVPVTVVRARWYSGIRTTRLVYLIQVGDGFN